MNPIETEWHKLKVNELRGQMFEHEIDLAYAVIDGIESRANLGRDSTDQHKFPSKTTTS